MKVGVVSGFSERQPPEFIAAAGKIVEQRGLHSFWVPEHVVFFPEYASRYPYSNDGKIPGNPTGVLDPFIALTYLAAHTSTLRLGTGICLVPQRNPIYTAKQVADVDYLSGGRFDFGVGVGWLREEFEALDVPWPARGARTVECLRAMQALWTQQPASFHGTHYAFDACLQNPKPVQQPHPPIYFGGESDAALKRVAELGQGWYGFQLDPETLEERLGRLDQLLTTQGRSRDDVRIVVAPKLERKDGSALKPFADLGVEQVLLTYGARYVAGLEKSADALGALAAEVA